MEDDLNNYFKEGKYKINSLQHPSNFPLGSQSGSAFMSVSKIGDGIIQTLYWFMFGTYIRIKYDNRISEWSLLS